MRVMHGLSKRGKTRATYRIWESMMCRCSNPKDKAYGLYGGRGIYVCERWRDPVHFYSDMGNRPVGMSLERKDNDGPYSPDNCIWADRITQANNRRNNRYLIWAGERKTIAELARITGIHERCIFDRIFRYGWPVDRALREPIGAKGSGTGRGVSRHRLR